MPFIFIVLTLFTLSQIYNPLCNTQQSIPEWQRLMHKWLPNVDSSTYQNANKMKHGKSNGDEFIKADLNPDERIQHYLSKRVEDAFTVNIHGCTGSIIGAQWLITAAHCLTRWRHEATHKLNEHGDYETTFEEWKAKNQLYKPRASHLEENELWTKGLPGQEDEKLLKDRIVNAYDDIFGSPQRGAKKETIHAKSGDERGWREFEKVLSHKDFQTEALSWKGADIGLIKLDAIFYGKRGKGSVAPACLASASHDMEQHRKQTYFAGYGRRFIPYCQTDDLGPESKATCGWPDGCSVRTARCGVEFLYQSEKHNKCLTDVDTPSMSSSVCSRLLKVFPELEKVKKKMHVFQGGKYITTCYPRRGDKGWCATRDPWNLPIDDTEPGPNNGWGFCSSAPGQQTCDKSIKDEANTTAFRVEPLSKEYCVNELGANLAVEQSHVQRKEYENVEEDFGVFCVAGNHTHTYANDIFFEILENKHIEKREASEKYISILKQKSNTKPYDIDGRICFGDSGGPVFQLVYDSKKDIVRPVIVGIFSFVLWGQCHGRHDPAYVVKVQFLEDWIRQYIPDEETCWV